MSLNLRRVSRTLFILLAGVALAGCNLASPPANNGGELGWGGGSLANPVATITSNIDVSDGSLRLPDSAEEALVFETPADSPKVIAPSFELIGKIAPPTVAGNRVNATHVTFFNKKAYISYNTPGEPYGGAIDVVDIADPASPKLVQSLTLPDMDVAASFAVANGKTLQLYIAGAMSRKNIYSIFPSYKSADGVPSTAILQRFDIKDDGTFDPGAKTSKITLLPGYVVTAVFQSSSPSKSYVFVTTGNDIVRDAAFSYTEAFARAGTFALNKDSLAVIDKDLYNYAMYLDIDNENARHISLQGSDGGSGVLHVYKVGIYDASAHKMVDLGPVNTFGTKNTVDLFRNKAAGWELGFVALGADGMRAYDIADASLPISSLPSERKPAYIVPMGETPEGIAAEDWLCNSVATDGEHVFLAAGAGGLWVADLPAKSLPLETETLKVWKTIDFSSSANFVLADSETGLIFVASGSEGTRIVSR